jgi:hypothetical protein
MRFLMTSFAILLALVVFGPGVTGAARGGDAGTNAGTGVGTAGVAGAPALPPAPVPVAAPTFAPAPPPAPDPTVAAGPVPSRAPVGQARAEFGNRGVPQTPMAGPIPAVPDARYTGQPVYGYYQSSPNGYSPGPYRYSTGYGGYYGPVHQGGYYYGPGGYYGQSGISIGLGFGRGIRIGF